jgi:solute carrier family 25 citrate transporter 1
MFPEIEFLQVVHGLFVYYRSHMFLSRQELSFAEVIGIGGISQGVAGFTTNPVDVLKTRVQSGLANTFMEGIQSVLKDGGLLAFWKGSLMRTLWILPQGCVYYPAYEFVQKVLKK